MPAVDDPFSIAASLPGQMATLKGQLKDLSVNNTQALTQALAAATAAAASAATASAAASAAATAATNAMVTATVGHASASGYALSTTPLELTRATITVPAGYTQALVFGTASMTILNQNGTLADLIRGYVDINGSAGAVSGGAYAGPGTPLSVAVSYSRLITGLTGGASFYVRCVFYNEAGNTGAAHPRNVCNLDSTVTFLR